MMQVASFALVLPLLLVTFSEGAEKRWGSRDCTLFTTRERSGCPVNKFLCFNKKCIEKGWYCDGTDDCKDNSDERFCNTRNPCPEAFFRCGNSHRCIPTEWINDGTAECADGEDENLPEMMKTSLQIPDKPASGTNARGSLVDKFAVALYLVNETSGDTRRAMAYEVSIGLLSRLARSPISDIPSTELASYVNALIVTCLDPRKFHGRDIIQELRSRHRETNPYVFLSLCNAGDFITESDRNSLLETFWNKKRPFWTEMQAYVVMALACASRQPGSDVDSEAVREVVTALKRQQFRNGSLEDLQTTALVLQALFSAETDEDPDLFDKKAAFKQIRESQKPDGTFDSPMDAYYVLPVFKCKSLTDVNNHHCPQNVIRDESTALEEMTSLSEPKIRVRYSLWIGDGKEIDADLALRVPSNSSFYRVMEMAAEIDPKYRFEYVIKDLKPYVTSVSGLRESVESGRSWFLHNIEEGKTSTAINESPVDLLPEQDDHMVMWYRSVSSAE